MEDLTKLTISQLKEKKENEMKEKYADIINDLATKYKKDLGVGFDMLTAIARAKILDKEPLYSSDLEYNLDELVEDYKEVLDLSEKSLME